MKAAPAAISPKPTRWFQPSGSFRYSTEKAAKTTSAQLGKVLEAFETRVQNVDEGDPDRAEIVRIYNDAQEAINRITDALDDLVGRIEAEASADAKDAETASTEATPAVVA